MHIIRPLASSKLLLAIILLASTFLCQLTSAQLFHGAAILKTPVGPDGTPRAHVGDTITATITIINLDDFLDTVTMTNIIDIVHHKIGDVQTTNLLAAPVTLISVNDLNSVGISSVNLITTYVVTNGDQTFADGLLKDDAQAGGIDNHDGVGGTHLAQDFFVTFPGQISVLAPCIHVTVDCENGAGERGRINFSGSVSNCGNTNTPLTNVVVMINQPTNNTPVTNFARLEVGQTLTFTGSYSVNDACQPSASILTARATDELGLTVSDQATVTCSNSVPAVVGDFVWEDLNHNGIQDAGEPGIANVKVSLATCLGSLITSTNTDANGHYLFSGLAPGNYVLLFSAPAGYKFTLPLQGGNVALDSNPDALNGLTACITLGCGETNLTIDAGLFRSACIGDFVWEDLNHNGIQDAGEPGISNVLVKLMDCSNHELARTNTDAGGLYHFCDLPPGNYQVMFVAPSGYVFTLPNQGSDIGLDSDANPATGLSACITLPSGGVNNTVDAGLVRPAAIGDFVWEDRNHNGIQDAGEPGIRNAVVRLLDCSSNLIATTNTDVNGLYHFGGLTPGGYIVQFVAPSGYVFTLQYQGGDITRDSDANPASGMSACITLASGETNNTVDAGLVRPAVIGDFVWEDLNHNGIQDAGEPGISNAVVRLLDCANNLIATTNTGANGIYHFGGLTPGGYIVQFVAPSGYQFTLQYQGGDITRDSDANPASGMSACITLASGETNNTVDAGLFRPACIGDFVWEDRNHNGLQDVGEPGIPGALVKLLDCSSNLIATTNTDANGLYHFCDLVPGSYQVMFVAPSGYQFTLPNQGSNVGLDSDANPATAMSACITLPSGGVNNTVDAGLFRPAAIGDFVWNDLDHDGLQTPGEPGIPNALVQLLDCSNKVIASTNTDANGFYLFSGLNPGGYIVQFSAPSQFTFTTPNVGADDTIDSDATPGNGRSPCVTLASGEINRTVDAGLFQLTNCIPACAIGAWSDPAYRPSTKPPGRNQAFWARGISTNLVFYPAPGGWVEDFTTGTAQLTGTLRSLTNLSSGFVVTMNLYGYTTTPPPGSPNEELDPSAYVRNGGPIDSSTWYYYTGFTGTLTGFGFWQGAVISMTRMDSAFQVGVGANGKNTHYGATGWWAWTVVHQPLSGNLPPQSVVANINLDLICCQPSKLGDFVWQDLNENGIQDAGEPGVPNVVVRLLDCTNKVVLTNTITDASGLYEFDNLLPGSYLVQFVAPSGSHFTLPNQGGDVARDSDAAQGTGLSQCVLLSSNDINLTIDAGLISNCPPSCVIGAWSDPAYKPADKPPGRNQAIWMRGISTNLVFSPDPGHWIENSDGTAQLTGTVRSLTNMSSGFDVTVNLSGRTTTAPSGSPMLELDPSAYIQNGGPADPASWYYYANFTGTLTGFGFWQGAVITVVRSGAAFQVGAGADGKNLDFGASAWFDWKVAQQPASGLLPSTGMGDFNLDLYCCSMPRVMSFQNTSTSGRRLTIQGLIGRTYTIEGSVDMVTWKPITTLQNVNGVLQFVDPSGSARCFYRIILEP